jgi:hypothetical protein
MDDFFHGQLGSAVREAMVHEDNAFADRRWADLADLEDLPHRYGGKAEGMRLVDHRHAVVSVPAERAAEVSPLDNATTPVDFPSSEPFFGQFRSGCQGIEQYTVGALDQIVVSDRIAKHAQFTPPLRRSDKLPGFRPLETI